MRHVALTLAATGIALAGAASAQAQTQFYSTPLYGSPSPYSPGATGGASVGAAAGMSTPAAVPPAGGAFNSPPMGPPPSASAFYGPPQPGEPPHNLGEPSSAMPPLPGPQFSNAPPAFDPDNPQGERATVALNLLERQGFGYFTNFRPAGSEFAATVIDNGQQFDVMIDPEAGQISR